ncbi:unnamed protein product [Rotaria socialis]|uniref:NAD(P)(+)--arginine ADP-ribosyltransferase n=1 Tax=Rotaria socialis TaxID=392032 RepID=A0A821SMH4_9BILA|nr:unnamed protein product [Rotaria socialis]
MGETCSKPKSTTVVSSLVEAVPQDKTLNPSAVTNAPATTAESIFESDIRAILSTINEAISRVSADRIVRRQQFDDTTTFQVSNDSDNSSDVKPAQSATILWFQLLIDYIIRLSEGPSLPELIDLCRQQYAGNVFDMALIEEFEDQYRSDKAIWWYTKDSFVYRLLNQALRERNLRMIILFREYIRDLIEQLVENQYSGASTITVYRGQALLVSEINRVRDQTSPLIVMQSFLSTSKNREVALSFAKQMVLPATLNPVLFEITADTQLKERPFADIARHSEFENEEEILFSVGCVFKATSLAYSDNVWLIKLTLCKTDEYEPNNIYSTMNAALDSSIDLDTFDRFLYDIGIPSWSDIQCVLPPKQQQLDLNNAKSVCAYADKLFRHHDDSVAGMEVATWYLKAIDLEGKLQPVNYLNLFKMYLKVAECLENDKIYYEKAKNIVTNLTEENGPLQTARLYFKLAHHCSLYSDRDHDEALDCYLACLHIQQEALPENDLNIALTYKQIATLHNDHLSSHEISEPSFSEYLVYTSIAEFFMGKCLSIQLKTLPATHPELAKTYF